MSIYGHSLSLLTDLYQLTMAYGYWKLGRADQRSVFHMTFRKHPFQGGYTVACGLHAAIEYLRDFKFDAADCDYLGTLTGNDGKPLFERGYLDYLQAMTFDCDVEAIPEGTVVFPHEPLPHDNPFWSHPKVTVTPHNAGYILPAFLVADVMQQIARLERGEPLMNLVDRSRGY